MKICPNPDCKQPNADNAVFCSECGWELKSKPKANILELYPDLKLVPTNFYNWRKPWLRHVYSVLIVALLLFFMTVTILYLYTFEVQCCESFAGDSYTYFHSGNGVGFLLGETYLTDKCTTPLESHELCRHRMNVTKYGCYGTSIFFIILFLLRFRYPTTNLHTVADYVQKYRFSGFFVTRKTRKYTFFVKNNQFGVLDYAHYKVALSAQYDYLEWHTKNKYLNATVNGETFIMDINGNKLK